MSKKRYLVPVTFTFTGMVEIHTTSKRKATNIAEASFGLVMGSGLHDSDSRIIDWDYALHPDKTVGEPSRDRSP